MTLYESVSEINLMLKALCKSQNIEWLPTQKEERARKIRMHSHDPCDGCREEREEEREWRKALLDYLSAPNLGHRGEYLTYDEIGEQLNDLRERFL